MKVIDIKTWKRKQCFEHFDAMADPYFGVTMSFDVKNAYEFSKTNNVSFFGRYLHDCMKAINEIDEFKYRLESNSVVVYDIIHASPTIMREDKSFGFSFVEFDPNLNTFLDNFEIEKIRIQNSNELYPPTNSLDCIHCSALPWIEFSGHKEPFSGIKDSVPKLAFSKISKHNDNITMNVAISANHAFIDGYHVGLFAEKFQEYLNE